MSKNNSGNSKAQRKRRLEEKLSGYGIESSDHVMEGFEEIPDYKAINQSGLAVTPERAAQRLLILLAVSYTSYSFEESDRVMEWLKKEELWKETSESEKEFFRHPAPSEEDKARLSWRFEGAYQLAWILDIVDTPSAPTKECSEEQVVEFFSRVPTVGIASEEFCSEAALRPEEEIIDEYFFYEKVKIYLDGIQTSRKENTSGIHQKASLERLHVLRWMTGFEDKLLWDEVITEDEPEY